VTSAEEQWQLDASAPALYERYLVPAVTALWAADLVERIDLQAGERVVDAACGTGVVARVAAERVGGGGRVAAFDVNPGMLEVARSQPPGPGANVEWHEASVLDLSFPDSSFDVALCQLGLQFFPDRPRALRSLRRVLVPGGRLALNVFGPIEHNPATHALSDALDRRVRPGASLTKRTEHALADVDELRALVAEPGFDDVEIDTVTKLIRFPSARHYVQAQLTATPLATLMAQYDEDARRRVENSVVHDVEERLAPYTGDGELAFPQEVHVAVGRVAAMEVERRKD
jgi:ubiquinone/menaquinone biosynthesis C-methylase UbiE